MQNWKFTLEYDGTDFSGWQSQPNGRTVQDVLEEGIRQISGESVRVTGAGRTDSGVHALGQVASVAIGKPFEPRSLQRSLNGVLPEDLVVLEAAPVPDDFNARFSAKSRSYRYSICRRPTAVRRRYVWECSYVLDFSVLHTCAEAILGLHDFASFSKVGTDVEHFRCSIKESCWEQLENSWDFVITADRFLYGMVRALVGTMVDVARGYRSLNEFSTIFEAKDRSAAGMAAPPKGLFLTRVDYQ